MARPTTDSCPKEKSISKTSHSMKRGRDSSAHCKPPICGSLFPAKPSLCPTHWAASPPSRCGPNSLPHTITPRRWMGTPCARAIRPPHPTRLPFASPSATRARPNTWTPAIRSRRGPMRSFPLKTYSHQRSAISNWQSRSAHRSRRGRTFARWAKTWSPPSSSCHRITLCAPSISARLPEAATLR